MAQHIYFKILQQLINTHNGKVSDYLRVDFEMVLFMFVVGATEEITVVGKPWKNL